MFKGSLWTLGMAVLSLLLLTPVGFLFFMAGDKASLNGELFDLAKINTLLLSVGVLLGSTMIGFPLAWFSFFYKLPGRSFFHALFLLPLAFPAYVLAFIYLGLAGPSSDFSVWSGLEIQGELWFLILVLSLALSPYVYFFSHLGLGLTTQSEVETERILKGGGFRFFYSSTWPKVFPFLLSAQILVLFETLSDFGAASMVNVPVITTMIYKLWFDLFSFPAAVSLSLRYSLLILILLAVEWFLKRNESSDKVKNRDPYKAQFIKGWPKWVFLILAGLFVSISVIVPGLQLLLWLPSGMQGGHVPMVLASGARTLLLGSLVSFLVILFSLVFHVFLYDFRRPIHKWNMLMSVGYGVPGSILAVSTYGLLSYWVEGFSTLLLVGGLILALSYKFLTVGFRPLGEQFCQIPRELHEASRIMGVSLVKQWTLFYWPYLNRTTMISLLLVAIEVMKEMPLTLMLSPGEFQTLSINIFNFTSEGEWEKASLPGFLLLLLGFLSVMILMRQQRIES